MGPGPSGGTSFPFFFPFMIRQSFVFEGLKSGKQGLRVEAQGTLLTKQPSTTRGGAWRVSGVEPLHSLGGPSWPFNIATSTVRTGALIARIKHCKQLPRIILRSIIPFQ
ncbi:hypothetical protein SUGI_0396710 [Cryptomeria japonica]|nr:hypothetical protein SUGI_0396710 [Cryptomeria japonica]